jgi:O-antigen/teichoic acid export membrane protein
VVHQPRAAAPQRLGAYLTMRVSHVAWNLGGLTLPLLVAALTVPYLLERLGHERFGLLALAWGLIGYAGALDLGLGRAVTQTVAKMRGEGNLTEIPNVLLTAGRLTLLTGLAAGVLIIMFALLGSANLIRTQATPVDEITTTILLLAIALPAQAMSATYKGLNEAFLNFRGISLLRAGLGVINFGGPFLVSYFTVLLPWLVATLVLSRLLSLLIYKYLATTCLRENAQFSLVGIYSTQIAKRLLSFGSWVTVSSVISPIFTQADRFLIAIIISASAVSTYVLPYEVVVQSLVLVGAVSSVMFPKLSQLMKEQPANWRSYFSMWLKRVTILMAIVCLILAMILPWLLSLWLGENLDTRSIVVGRILCLGVFASSVGAMYYAMIHAKGRADISAKLHIIQFPIYLMLLYFSIQNFGLTGAAIAWVSRTTVDALALAICARTQIYS